jgi:hypothetical protein
MLQHHGVLRSGIEDFEASIRPGGQFQIVGCVRLLRVSYEFGSAIVRGTSFFRKMQLPKILQTRRLLNNVPRGGRSTLFGSVVNDCNPGSDCIQECRAIALVPAVMRDDVDIDGAKLADRTHQLHFLVSGQIAQVQNL